MGASNGHLCATRHKHNVLGRGPEPDFRTSKTTETTEELEVEVSVSNFNTENERKESSPNTKISEESFLIEDFDDTEGKNSYLCHSVGTAMSGESIQFREVGDVQ